VSSFRVRVVPRYQAKDIGKLEHSLASFEIERDEPLREGDTFEWSGDTYCVLAMLLPQQDMFDGFMEVERLLGPGPVTH